MKNINRKGTYECHSEEEVEIKECCVAKHAIVSYRVFVLIEVNRSEVIRSASHSVSQLVSQLVSQSVCLSVCQSVSQ